MQGLPSSVDDLVKGMGMIGISKFQVSRLCGEPVERVGAFLNRPIEGDWPYPWLDATYVKTLTAGSIVSVAETVAANIESQRRMGSAAIAIAFAQETAKAANAHWRVVAGTTCAKWCQFFARHRVPIAQGMLPRWPSVIRACRTNRLDGRLLRPCCRQHGRAPSRRLRWGDPCAPRSSRENCCESRARWP